MGRPHPRSVALVEVWGLLEMQKPTANSNLHTTLSCSIYQILLALWYVDFLPKTIKLSRSSLWSTGSEQKHDTLVLIAFAEQVLQVRVGKFVYRLWRNLFGMKHF